MPKHTNFESEPEHNIFGSFAFPISPVSNFFEIIEKGTYIRYNKYERSFLFITQSIIQQDGTFTTISSKPTNRRLKFVQ